MIGGNTFAQFGKKRDLSMSRIFEVDNLRSSLAEDFEAHLGEVSDFALRKETFALVSALDMVAEKALELAMLDSAFYRDQSRGLATLRQAKLVLDEHLISTLRRHQEICTSEIDVWRLKPLNASQIWFAFVINILLDDLARARELAEWNLRAPPFLPPGKRLPAANFASIFYSALLDDPVMFEVGLDELRGNSNSPGLYLDIAKAVQSVLSRNIGAFESYLGTADAEYVKRGKLRMKGQFTRTDLGIDGYAEFYFDYVTALLIRMAREKGMQVAIPKLSAVPIQFL